MSGAEGAGSSRVPEGWLSRLAEEPLMCSARRIDDQQASGPLAYVLEGVDCPVGYFHKRASRSRDRLFGHKELELTFQHIESLIIPRVEVGRGSSSWCGDGFY
jgi:hypothetical protein